MKLSEILNEAKVERRSTDTSMLEAIDFIRTNCSDIVARYKKNNNRIYRGFSNDGLRGNHFEKNNKNFLYGDTSIRTRKSRNTENYYTLIMDNSAQWKKYPKRSESFICSSSSSYASDFGYLHVAFPVNGTKIGICPGFDLWAASEKEFGGMDYGDINRVIKTLSFYYKIEIDDSDYKSFLRSIDKLGKNVKPEVIEKQRWWGSEKKFVEKIIRNAENLSNFIQSVFSPEKFELQTMKNFDPPSNREMWFSGKCVFVNADSAIHMGPDRINDYMKYKKAGNPDIENLTVNSFIREL